MADLDCEISSQDAPRILFIDAYDSFSNNIISLVRDFTRAQIITIKVDDARYAGVKSGNFVDLLRCFDGVIAGPGPGSPEKHADVGLIDQLWTLEEDDLLPVLGICLGFQSLALAHGAKIERLDQPQHGIVTSVIHNQASIFSGIGNIMATQYNSLHATLHDHFAELRLNWEEVDLFSATERCPSLRPLAWARLKAPMGLIPIAVEHIRKPFWGVQYHPESICTNEEGAKVLLNWWNAATEWNTRNNRRVQSHNIESAMIYQLPKVSQTTVMEKYSKKTRNYSDNVGNAAKDVAWRKIPLHGLDVVKACNAISLNVDQVMLLESGTRAGGTPINPETGRFSIMGCISPHTERLEYYASKQNLIISSGEKEPLIQPVGDVWSYLNSFMTSQKRTGGPNLSPFWGGLIGFVSYEASLDTLGVKTIASCDERPDLCFAFVERSIVLDHNARHVYIQSIRESDGQWLAETEFLLKQAAPGLSAWASAVQKRLFSIFSYLNCLKRSQEDKIDLDPALETPRCSSRPIISTTSPSRCSYISRISSCLSSIRAGDSYELCLTARTTVHIPASLSATTHTPWRLYQRLRQLNPAPFSAFLHLPCAQHLAPSPSNTITILSSSPERFLRWSRPASSNAPSTVQFRPIKGTVTRAAAPTRAAAEALLNNPKERAENLMIVDLIRHDLHGVLGPAGGAVHVAKLMGVEEYATVWQLVSVVEGELPPPVPLLSASESSLVSEAASLRVATAAAAAAPTGIDVLAASLPPGSMTGAPKRRSCALLHDIEACAPRGPYSGVLGYMDVGGGGDFSVVIRTAWRWGDGADDDEEGGERRHTWNVGAGGAITAQSVPGDEWEEMRAKRAMLLRMFGAREDER